MESVCTVVLGNFDGLHRGHQQLIRLGRQIADEHGESLAVFTFHPQIQQVFDPAFCYLLTDVEKQRHFRRLGVDVIETVPFEEQIAHLSPEEFIQQILIDRMHAAHVVVGFNYSFGYRGAGTSQMLQELCSECGIEVTIMEPCYVDGQVVSSTAVRTALREGHIEQANSMLGYVYTLEGTVVKGNQIGRTIGFPTANLNPPEHLLLPVNGVYAAITEVDGIRYPGILNIGMRPTIKNSVGINVEVNLFDFSEDIYGKIIRTELHYFLRPEVKFNGLDALKAQLRQDEQHTRQLFSSTDTTGL